MTRETENIKYNGITEGVIWKQILSFFFPLFFGTFFQMLYNTVDAIIVGQALGKEALAAVGGGTSTLINLLIGFFTGVSSGATVVISQYYGARDEEKSKKAVHTAISLSLIFGIIVTAVGLVFASPILRLISTPDEIMPLAEDYLRIYFAGALTIVIYNMGAGIFRALGDSRHPLYFLIAGAALNTVLDILFIVVFKMGVKGAAYATVLSQVLSSSLTLIYLARRKDFCRFRINELGIDKKVLKNMLRIGIPAGIQSVMYNISNMLVQTRVNGFGTDTAAAWAAYGKLDYIFWMMVNAFGTSTTTFVGQNYGAGKIDRAKKGVRTCFFMTAVATSIMICIYLVFGRYGYLLFVSDENVIEIGMRILQTVAPTFLTYITIEIISGASRGTGKAVIPTLFTVVGICGLRILWLNIPMMITSVEKALLCYPVSWTIDSILFIIYYKSADIFDERKRSISAAQSS